METFTAKAAADLRVHQYNIVRLSAENTVNVASLATTSAIAGVLLNKPNTGEGATVGYFGTGQVRAGAAISANAIITTNGSGRAVSCSSGDLAMIVGRALEAATADGDIIDVILHAPFRWPGAV